MQLFCMFCKLWLKLTKLSAIEEDDMNSSNTTTAVCPIYWLEPSIYHPYPAKIPDNNDKKSWNIHIQTC